MSAWQISRLQQRRVANQALTAGRELPPLDLATALNDGTPINGRRIIAVGHYDTSREIILRGRVQDDAPGLQIATPFILAEGHGRIWVLRGFLRVPDGFTPPETIPAPPNWEIQIAGVVYPLPETTDSGAIRVINGDSTWQRMDRGRLLARLPGSPAFYLNRIGDDAVAGLIAVPLPPVDDGPHLSYAVQWVGIALAIISFAWLMIWKRPEVERVP